jgi:hypothetical protein
VRSNGDRGIPTTREPAPRREALPYPVEEEIVEVGERLSPGRYEYRVVPIPPPSEAPRGDLVGADPEGEAAARLLQAVIDEQAEGDWEFQGVQSVAVGRGRGRLGTPFGGDRRVVRDVAVFRRKPKTS